MGSGSRAVVAHDTSGASIGPCVHPAWDRRQACSRHTGRLRAWAYVVQAFMRGSGTCTDVNNRSSVSWIGIEARRVLADCIRVTCLLRSRNVLHGDTLPLKATQAHESWPEDFWISYATVSVESFGILVRSALSRSLRPLNIITLLTVVAASEP